MRQTKQAGPTGINKALEQGIPTEEFKGRVICKKCGKDIEFTKGSELFLKCPRCKTPLERNLNEENKQARRIIRYAFLRRAKKYLLVIALFLTAAALAYNILGFFTHLFANSGWWLALVSLPFIILSVACTNYARLKSTTKKLRVLSWLTVVLNVVALAVVIVTVIPDVNARLAELYKV